MGTDSDLPPLGNVVVVAVATEGPQNAGSIARLCGNFGCVLRFVDVRADVECRDALKMAHPCEDALVRAPRFTTLHEALHDVAISVGTSGKIAGAMRGAPLDASHARTLLPAPPERLAVVFGNERTGLSVHDAALCTRLVRLPTPGDVDSLNLASAVACTLTILHEAVRGSSTPRASLPAREHMQLRFEDALAAAGFFRTTTRDAFAPRVRELVDKMDFSERDAALFAEMCTLFAGKPPRDDG